MEDDDSEYEDVCGSESEVSDMSWSEKEKEIFEDAAMGALGKVWDVF